MTGDVPLIVGPQLASVEATSQDVAFCHRCGVELTRSKRGPTGRFCSAACKKAVQRAQRAAGLVVQSGVLSADSCAAGPKAGGGVESAAPALPGAGLAENPGHPGLVICATTGRISELEDKTAGQSVSQLPGVKWSFPSLELVGVSAGLFPEVLRSRLRSPESLKASLLLGELEPLAEGPRPRLVVSPGSLTFERRDYARAERTQQRWLESRRQQVAYLAAYFAECGEFPKIPDPTRVVTEFSAKSRGRMMKVFTQLDYTPLFSHAVKLLAVGTLTYPADWVTVAPNGRAAKRHLKIFRKRYKRAWGVDLVCTWKFEFQERGAPHWHFLHAPPHGFAAGSGTRGVKAVGDRLPYKQWLSAVWADIVAHPDPEERRKHLAAGTNVEWATGLRSTDPKRIAVYFTKHGLFHAKEYQNQVPEEWQELGNGPGRFWGYWGMEKALATVELSQSDYQATVRILRRWIRAQGTTRQVRRWYQPGGQVQSKYAEVIGLAGAQLVGAVRGGRWRLRRGPVRWLANGAGFVSLNDGPQMASALARLLVKRPPETSADRRARLVAATGSIASPTRVGHGQLKPREKILVCR